MAEAVFSPIVYLTNADTRKAGGGETMARFSPLRTMMTQELEPVTDSQSVAVTASDLRELMRLLRKHPNGLLALERQDAFHKRILAPDKLAAYRMWQVITQEGELLRLSPFGEQLAAVMAAEIVPLRALLQQVTLYREALEWLYAQSITLVTDQDIVSHWQSLSWLTASWRADDVATLKAQAISFFHLCQAADFGIVTLGKRGQPARLRVERRVLNEYLHDTLPHPIHQAAQT